MFNSDARSASGSSDDSSEEVALTAAMELALQLEDCCSLFPRALEPRLLDSIESIARAEDEQTTAPATIALAAERGAWTDEAKQAEHKRLLAEHASLVRGVVYMTATPESAPALAEPVVKAVPVLFSYAMGFVRAREGSAPPTEEYVSVTDRHESLLTLLLQEESLRSSAAPPAANDAEDGS